MNGAHSLSALCLILLGSAVCIEILSRGLLGEPTIWALEVSGYLLTATIFIGMGPALASDEHIRIDLLTRKLSLRVQRFLRAVAMLAIAIYAAIATFGGVEMVLHSMQFGRRSLTLMSIPVWIPQMFLPIGMGLLCLAALAGLRSAMKEVKTENSDG